MFYCLNSASVFWRSARYALLLFSATVSASVMSVAHAQNASSVFENYQQNLFVIESFDRISNNKNSVGSGFTVGDGAFIATNYHVVADAVMEPENYAVRAVGLADEAIETQVVAADPIHDLAVLRVTQSDDADATYPESGLVLAETKPTIGEELVALGNPFDVGISVVPGTYNGELKKHFRPLIHFTGALNPGMSGGPTVNMNGEVIGINVAGAGNSVGFLVPVDDLQALLKTVDGPGVLLGDVRDRFAEAIRTHNDALIDDLLAGDWSLETFGPIKIPKVIREYVNCRGSAKTEDEDRRWTRSISDCRVADRLYLRDRFDTGPLEMQFTLLESDYLNATQFATVFSGENFQPFNRGGKDHFTEFDCVERWTLLPNLGEQRFKASYCVRAYLDFPELYDVLYVARGMPSGTTGLNVHYTLAGVGEEAASRFHSRFLEAPEWN
ncbi:MAG: S1C family serine protease [Pseudomonadota bacterium]